MKRKSKVKKILINVLISCLSLIVCFSVLEIYLRLFHKELNPVTTIRHTTPTAENEEQNIRALLKLPKWINTPLSAQIYERSCFKTELKYNSLGIRENEYPFEKEQDVYRILILGDSYAEGKEVLFEKRFSNILQDELNKNINKYKRIELINTGIYGYCSIQKLGMFLRIGKYFKPDLVIDQFFINDPDENLRLFNDYKILTKKRIALNIEDTLPEKQPFYKSLYLYRFLKFRLSQVSWLRPSIKRTNFEFDTVEIPTYKIIYTDRYAPEDEIEIVLRKYDISYMQMYQNPIPLDVYYGWIITYAYYIELKRLCKEIGAELMVLIIPHAFGLSYNPHNFLIRLLNKQKIQYLSLETFFNGVEGIILECDGHWSEKGHELCAKYLTDFVQTHYLPD
ncbi:MAG: SGNH/GDSL hydrolase family protein [Candidatus Aminicenantaceae bacterium]